MAFSNILSCGEAAGGGLRLRIEKISVVAPIAVAFVVIAGFMTVRRTAPTLGLGLIAPAASTRPAMSSVDEEVTAQNISMDGVAFFQSAPTGRRSRCNCAGLRRDNAGSADCAPGR